MLPLPPHHWGRPLLSAQQARGPCSKQASKRALLTPTRPGHAHLHVAMDVGGQGGPVEDEVVHHHVQCQSWSPVGDGLLQGARRLLLGFDLLLNGRNDHQEKGPVLRGERDWDGRCEAAAWGSPTLPAPDSFSPQKPRWSWISHWLRFGMQPNTAASQDPEGSVGDAGGYKLSTLHVQWA